MKNSNDTIRNQTRDLPTCSAVPQNQLHHHVSHCVSVQVLFVNADNTTGCLTLNLSGSVGEREKSPNFSHVSEKPQCTMIIKEVNFVAIAFHERKWFLIYVCIHHNAPKQCFYC